MKDRNPLAIHHGSQTIAKMKPGKNLSICIVIEIQDQPTAANMGHSHHDMSIRKDCTKLISRNIWGTTAKPNPIKTEPGEITRAEALQQKRGDAEGRG